MTDTDPTSHFDRTSQYHRPSVVKGNAATCPCCLKFHEVITSGRMVRHGWKETGRRVGEYGMGFQWGNCHGWSLRPLQETEFCHGGREGHGGGLSPCAWPSGTCGLP